MAGSVQGAAKKREVSGAILPGGGHPGESVALLAGAVGVRKRGAEICSSWRSGKTDRGDYIGEGALIGMKRHRGEEKDAIAARGDINVFDQDQWLQRKSLK